MAVKKIRRIIDELYDSKTFRLIHESIKQPLDNIEHLSHFMYGYYHLGLRKNSLHQFLESRQDWRFCDEIFLLHLQKANLCGGYYDPNWKIVSITTSGEVYVKKNDITILCQKHHFKVQEDLKMGNIVSVKFPKDRILIPNGFYFVISNCGNPDFSKPVTRFYFNTNVYKVEEFIKRLTRELCNRKIIFQFKTLLNPSHYKRLDSSVLYINKIDYEKTLAIICNIHKRQINYFLPGIPFLSKRILSGIGIAEEPQNSKESFGQHRINLIAGSLLSGSKKKLPSQELLRFVLKDLEKHDLNINRLYLNPFSDDIY